MSPARRSSPSLASSFVLLLSLMLARSIADGASLEPSPAQSPDTHAAELHTVVAPPPQRWLIAGGHVASHPWRGAVAPLVRTLPRIEPCPPTFAHAVTADAPFVLADLLSTLDASPALVFGIWRDVPAAEERADDEISDPLIIADVPFEALPPSNLSLMLPLARPEIGSTDLLPDAFDDEIPQAWSSVSFDALVHALGIATLACVLLVPFVCAGLAPRMSA